MYAKMNLSVESSWFSLTRVFFFFEFRASSWKKTSPLRALLLRHMPLQRCQAFPRLLLVDHRRHPPDSAERESQNLETGSDFPRAEYTRAKHAVSPDGSNAREASKLAALSSLREREPALEAALASTRAPLYRPTSPHRTRLNRAPNAMSRFPAITSRALGAPVMFQPST